MIDIRRIFDKHRVPWRDHGPNTSKGNINIGCPFCKNDPSFHMAVAEDGSGWYCWRNSRHQGAGLGYLFHVLKIPTEKMHLKGSSTALPEPTKEVDLSAWRYFAPAEESRDVCDYLEFRGFSRPRQVCKQFDLKYAPEGKWAARMIAPLTSGWTGRALYPHIQPRYLSQTDGTGLFAQGRSSSVILVEGPLDAMRLASLTSEFTVIATLGQRLSPTLMFHLRALGTQSIHLIPDSDVPPHLYLYFIRHLASFLPSATITKISVPRGYKDCCEMSEERTYEFLREFQTKSFSSFQLESTLNDTKAGSRRMARPLEGLGK